MRLLLLAIAALALAPLPVRAADMLILQSTPTRTMDQVTRLVQNNCNTSNRTVVLSDYAEADIGRLVREERPSVLVAIGDRAVTAAKKIRAVPVVYGMALKTDENTLGDNVSGVSMIVAPQSYLQLFASLRLRRVGIIYDRNHTGAYLRRAQAAAAGTGIELVPLPVRSPKEVQQRLLEMGGRSVDAIWLLPDATAVTPETVDSYFGFALQHDLPVIGFSAAYLAKGALAAVELTRQEIGNQLCEKIRGGGGGTTDSPAGRLSFNSAVANKLGIRIPPASALPAALSPDG